MMCVYINDTCVCICVCVCMCNIEYNIYIYIYTHNHIDYFITQYNSHTNIMDPVILTDCWFCMTWVFLDLLAGEARRHQDA